MLRVEVRGRLGARVIAMVPSNPPGEARIVQVKHLRLDRVHIIGARVEGEAAALAAQSITAVERAAQRTKDEHVFAHAVRVWHHRAQPAMMTAKKNSSISFCAGNEFDRPSILRVRWPALLRLWRLRHLPR